MWPHLIIAVSLSIAPGPATAAALRAEGASGSALHAGAFAPGHGRRGKPKATPKEENANLKAELEAVEAETKKQEEKAEKLQEEVKPMNAVRTTATEKHVTDSKVLSEEVSTLRKEVEEKVAKCNAEYQAAQKAMKEVYMGTHDKAFEGQAAKLLLSAQRAVGGRAVENTTSGGEPSADEEEPEKDKMEYIEENKELKKDLKKAKDELTRQRLHVQRAEAMKIRANASNNAWKRMLKASTGTYEAQKTHLEAQMKLAEKKCVQAADIKKATPAVKKVMEPVGVAIEDARYAGFYDWKYLENEKSQKLKVVSGAQMPAGAKETLEHAELKCAKNDDCNYFCWSPNGNTGYYPTRTQGYESTGSGWKCYSKKTKETWSWHFLNNNPEQELLGRDDDRALQHLKGEKDSLGEAEAKCASDKNCNYFCHNPDDWSSYYESRKQGYRQVGRYGAGWKCYSKSWEGDPKPEPLAAARLHTVSWYHYYWDGKCTVCPARWWRWKHCKSGGYLVSEKGCGWFNAGCEGLCAVYNQQSYWVNHKGERQR